MMQIRATLRRKAVDALSGRMGSIAQHLAWAAARLHPVLRASVQWKKGHIHAALQMLERSGRGDPEAVRLKERLADMAAFCAGGRGLAAPSPDPVAAMACRVAFNGRVLYALHNCGAFDPSGYSSRSVALITAMRAQGVDPVITTRPGYPWDLAHHVDTPKCDQVQYQGLHFQMAPDSAATIRDPETRYIDGYALRLQSLASSNSVSVIHAASNFLNGAAAAIAGRALGIASIYEVRGLWHLTRAFTEPGYALTDHYRYCEKRELAACAEVDHVITLSGGLRQWLIERGIPAGKISIVGNAAPTRDGARRPDESAALAVRAKHRIPAAAKVIGYLGAIVAYEGLDALIRAHARTPAADRPYLLIVGSGAHEAALRKLVSKLGTTSQVVFAGRVTPDQVPAYYAAMDAVVLPRRDDILTRLVPALKPFEVLAHGRPLFVSPVLAQALADTLPAGYQVLDVDAVDRLDRLLSNSLQPPSTVDVPTWGERSAQVIALYRALASAQPCRLASTA